MGEAMATSRLLQISPCGRCVYLVDGDGAQAGWLRCELDGFERLTFSAFHVRRVRQDLWVLVQAVAAITRCPVRTRTDSGAPRPGHAHGTVTPSTATIDGTDLVMPDASTDLTVTVPVQVGAVERTCTFESRRRLDRLARADAAAANGLELWVCPTCHTPQSAMVRDRLTGKLRLRTACRFMSCRASVAGGASAAARAARTEAGRGQE